MKQSKLIISTTIGDVEIILFGSKTSQNKLFRIIRTERALFQDKSIEEMSKLIQRALNNTRLFDQVIITKIEPLKIYIQLTDTITLLPIVNFSSDLENISYTVGAQESDLFNERIGLGGSFSKSESSQNISWWASANQPIESLENISVFGSHGDTWWYSNKSWHKFDRDDMALTLNFKNIFKDIRIFYGVQFRYTDFEFKDDPIFNTSLHLNFGRFDQNHDISEGYRVYLSFRYLDDRYNKYNFQANYKKHYYIPIRNNTIFRGFNLNYEIDYTLLDENNSAVGVYFSFRNGALHGIRSNSVFETYMLNFNQRYGITSKKWLWTYWQPHIFIEAGLTPHDTYYSVGGGLLLTFTPLFNSRLRIQYFTGELPEKNNGFIVSTTLDF